MSDTTAIIIRLGAEVFDKGMGHARRTSRVLGGDQDYIKALEEVKREGKRIVLVCFKSSFSAELRQIADDSIFIDDISEMVKK